MPIVKPKRKPTKYQLVKAENCVVLEVEGGFDVCNPFSGSFHTVQVNENENRCDCEGYFYSGYCYHITAVEIHQKL